MTTIAAPVTGRSLLSSLHATTEATATTQEATDVSAIAMTTNSSVSRQQIIDAFLAELSVYSEQYNELLKEGVKIDTTPAQNVLKSSLPLLLKTDSGIKSTRDIWDIDTNPRKKPIDWTVPLDGNMDKDGDGVFDLDANGDGKVDDYVDYSQYTWDTKDNGGVPQSDWEIYANVATELAGLKTTYMDVYTDLANQSVEFLDAVNGFKTRMVKYITSGTGDNKDKIYIDVHGVKDELNSIIDSWGKYVTVPTTDEKGNVTGEKTIPNTDEINPPRNADGSKPTPPSSGPVAIRGLDLAGVDYWAVQLNMEDQLVVDKEVTAGKDGKMGTEETDMDNVTVYHSITVVPDTPENSNQLYLVQENGTYTLYVYPDIQPIIDADNFSTDSFGYRYNAGTSGPTNAPSPLKKNDVRYHGDNKFEHDYKKYDGDDTYDKRYFVIPTSKDLMVVPTDAINKSYNMYYIPAGYTLVTSTSTEDYHAYDCFLIPTKMLDPQLTNSSKNNKDSVHVTEPVIMQAEMYVIHSNDNTTGSYPGESMANIYFAPMAEWDFAAHGASTKVSVSTSVFNEWENSMNTMSSTVESDSQVMSEKLNQANTIYNNLTKVVSSTIEALLETQKEFLR
ncbi:IpaD/SipD/SspD family type III secretion system needle tip protein [Citrobacter sp. Cu233]|uniref:IpaD/SipD/SspD family type III secretion system needle tip protein n=1 Tax=Citrobacter sp. Cu233 TaxID=2985160 RepID=UPI0025791483|nr:IpaD/SipD/SspD family type III secretion system needle tip protein [Citrobacter sp. Cu233]MDM2932055.1 IpaD/SipD/SspD family type III secretion system needle tip protein [Citrobacter sp. Cu233]